MTDLKPEKKAMIESKTITVAYQVKGRRADRVVTADIIGPLAVHPTVNEDGAWTVTHVVTGHAVYRFFSSNLEAVAIAKELAAHRGWIGSVEEIMANGELKRAVTQALRAIGVMVK